MRLRIPPRVGTLARGIGDGARAQAGLMRPRVAAAARRGFEATARARAAAAPVVLPMARAALGPPPAGIRGEIARNVRAIAITAAALVLGVGGWACLTSLNGAVIAAGQLVVESDVKKVQHPTGGVVGELLVREGDHVKAGQVLVRLDVTQVKAGLDIVLKALDELAARKARDEAERDGADAVAFPSDLLLRAKADPVAARLVEGESRLFSTRVAAREGQRSQLTERVSQLRQEVSGLEEQATAKEREVSLIGEELKGVRELRAKNLVPLTRLTALERDAARLSGERGQLLASRAQALGKITETELQRLQVDQDMRAEVGKDLAEIRGKASELAEKRISSEDQLARTDLRAPQDGVVHQMSVHTVGGLVTASEPAMLIVPERDRLVVEAKVQPQDIDHVRAGQSAVLRLSALDQRTTPEVEGTVTRVSADVTQDPRTGLSHYVARVSVDPGSLARVGDARLVPGMPVETFIQTGARTVLSYLTRPLADQVARAWRER